MEIGAFFILLIVLGALSVGGVLLFAVAARLRRAKLDPEEDKLEGDAYDGHGDARGRPEHVRVRGEQRARFVTHR